MKSILIIVPAESTLTGGLKVDFYLFEQLRKSNKLCVDFMIDEKLNCTNKMWIFYNAVRYFGKIFRFRKFDYILINSRLYPNFTVIPMIRLFCNKTQVVTIHHHFNFLTQNGMLRIAHKALELFFIRMCNQIIIVSPYVKDLISQMHFLGRKKINYIEIAFDHTKVHQASKAATNDFLFVGTVEQRKGVDAIIEAVFLLKQENIPVNVNIIGNILHDSYYQALINKINEYKLSQQIRLLGRVSDDELQSCYSSSRAFLFPSRHEGYGMVLIEAMSYGLPVIAFNNSAIPYFVKNGANGLLVKNNDVEDLSEKMKLLWTDNTLRGQLSIRALEYFDKTRTYDDWNQDIDNFINQL
ncbi:MAG: glycosyltransferase family 4 protein [Prevotellaceae bacterium]|jgi:glycosyltransferase involved in cell wall biosynthesis|nr:glycosyltransferase family 4 protein [Prevotellaceae bacterium]